MQRYNATISGDIFVGTDRILDPDYEGYDLEPEELEAHTLWKQQPICDTYENLKQTIESIVGIKCVSIAFGKYNPDYGTLFVENIVCEYDGADTELLRDLVDDEVYIVRGGKYVRDGAEPAISVRVDNIPSMIALHFKK